ncbi:uncharacterized protein VTP21DRAFT_5048 [Calcarisporiella thermophila]|uniref:uncharacterized protein n=1 Tax=Calcarisporiella thermophila TaxID=911321 RepID=UPI0037421669
MLQLHKTLRNHTILWCSLAHILLLPHASVGAFSGFGLRKSLATNAIPQGGTRSRLNCGSARAELYSVYNRILFDTGSPSSTSLSCPPLCLPRAAMTSSLVLVLVLLLARVANAANVTVNWDITYVQANPDGQYPRQVVGVNGKWPPPPIVANYSDTLIINVHNSLDVPTSLHSHGLFQNGTAYYDGPVGVTQCGIPPGANFTYQIPIQQWGTYWIHSHYRGQYVDGLRAPLILHAPKEHYTYDQEYTVVVSDWYHYQSEDRLKWYLGIYNPTGAEPTPDSALINHSQNETFQFAPGKTYRLRVINMSAFAMFLFSIDGHEMDIIEVDGVDVNRTTVTGFPITAAQRYSVLVTAKNTTDKNYLIHADMDTTMFDSVPPELNPNVTATIVYNDTASTADAYTAPFPDDFDDTTLVPVVAEASVPADVRHYLDVFFNVHEDGTNRAMFNNITYVMPKVPTLLSQLSLGELAKDPAVYGRQTQAIVLEHNKMVELVVTNYDENAHPFHLHGHQFQVLGRGNSTPYDPASAPLPEKANPVRRDTVQIPKGGYVVLRFRADNPGVWFFHCHIEWHLEAGLAMTFIEAPLEAQKRIRPPQQIYDQCHALGIQTSGNAAGKNGTDLEGAPYGPFPLPGRFTPKGIGALAATIISALIGLGVVIWYAQDDKKTIMRRNGGAE